MNNENLKLYRKARSLHGNVLEVLYNYYECHENFFIEQVRDFFANRKKSNPSMINVEMLKIEGRNYNDLVACYIYPSEIMAKPIAEVAKDKNLIKNVDNKEMLESVLNANFGIYTPIEYNYENKTILLLNILNEEKHLIIDEKLAESIYKVKDLRFMLITRILNYKNINFMSNSIILDFDKECIDFVKKVKSHNLTSIDIYYFGLQYTIKHTHIN